MKIFFSYSHKDEALCKELQKHLGPLKKANLIEHWHDREIKPGEYWDEKIKENLNEADIILFLVSPDFLDSDYIYEKEIKIALSRYKRGEATVVPIMLRKCDIEYTLFKDIQGLPTDLEPINSKKWYSIDDACFDVVEGLKKIIKQQKKKKEILIAKLEEEQRSSKLSNSYKKVGAFRKLINLFKSDDESYYRNIVLNTEVIFLKSEMEEISREIHDDIGQKLSLVKLQLAVMSSVDKDKLNDARLVIASAMNSLRQLSDRLYHRNSEIDFNLKQALLELESYFIKMTNSRFIFVFSSLDKITNPRLEINIFRIIQELLNNVIRHSEASTCNVLVKVESDLILINVNDNGKGFLITQNTRGGLEHIRSRVNYYSGRLTINSNPNQGCKIEISLPAK